MSARSINVTLECFVKKGNRFLLLHRNSKKRIMPDVWMGPGGHREYNEGLFETARREILEETGLKIKNIAIRAVGCAILEDINAEVHFHLLTADYSEGTLHKSPEDGELVWLTPSEILKLDNLLAELKHVLPFVLDRRKQVISYKAIYDKSNHMIDFALENNR